METLVGTAIGGYTLIKLLGTGGMGSVYLASDPAIDQYVAVKLIRTDLDNSLDVAGTRMALERFRQEARAVARLDHLHILPLYRYGEEQTPQGQRAYMIMQYRPEGSLWDWLRRRAALAAGTLQPTPAERASSLPTQWPLNLREVAGYVQQAASALQYAHEQGIVHRDVKPANFLLRVTPQEKNVHLLLSDFGLAKVLTGHAATSTILGTPTYMAPEQFEGAARPESDQYALAVMAYYLLAGHAPFVGDPMQLMHQHLSAQVPPLTGRHLDIPPSLNGVFARALAKQPEQRFPSVLAFAEAFVRVSQERSSPSIAGPEPLVLPGALNDARRQHDAATAMSLSPALPAAPVPGSGDSSRRNEGQPATQESQSGNWGSEAEQKGDPRGNQPVNRRRALAWILGGTGTVAAIGVGASLFLSTQNKHGTRTSPPANPTPTPTSTPQSQGTVTSDSLALILRGHTAAITSVSWLPGGTRLATGSLDRTVRLWSPANGRPLATLPAASAVHALAWSPDGNTLAAGLEDGVVQLWHTNGALIKRETGWGAMVDALAWSTNTILFLGTDGNDVHAVDIQQGTRYDGQKTHARVTSLALSPDSQFIAVAFAEGSVYLADLRTTKAIATIPITAHGAAHAVAWSPVDNMIAVGYDDGHAIIYDGSHAGSKLSTLSHGGPVYSVNWSPQATRALPVLACGSGDRRVTIWGLTDPGTFLAYAGHTDAVLAVAWGPHFLASGSKDRTARLWKLPNA